MLHVKDIKEDNTIKNILFDDKTNYQEVIYDFDFNIDDRILAFKNLYEIKGEDIAIEHIRKLGTMYILSNNKLVEQFLQKLCISTILNYNFRLTICNFLCKDINNPENNNILVNLL